MGSKYVTIIHVHVPPVVCVESVCCLGDVCTVDTVVSDDMTSHVPLRTEGGGRNVVWRELESVCRVYNYSLKNIHTHVGTVMLAGINLMYS